MCVCVCLTMFVDIWNYLLVSQNKVMWLCTRSNISVLNICRNLKQFAGDLKITWGVPGCIKMSQAFTQAHHAVCRCLKVHVGMLYLFLSWSSKSFSYFYVANFTSSGKINLPAGIFQSCHFRLYQFHTMKVSFVLHPSSNQTQEVWGWGWTLHSVTPRCFTSTSVWPSPLL
jgi:hypothetical protein